MDSMKLVTLFLVLLVVAVPVSAQDEEIQIEPDEEYAPLISLSKWSRGGLSFWWKMILVQDDADAALAEVRLKVGRIEYRVEYPCFDTEGKLLPHVYQTVVWERGNEANGVFTDCGTTPIPQEVPLIATELLGAPPDFYEWGILRLSGL